MRKRTLFIRSVFALFKNLVSLSFLFFSIVPMRNEFQVVRIYAGRMWNRPCTCLATAAINLPITFQTQDNIIQSQEIRTRNHHCRQTAETVTTRILRNAVAMDVISKVLPLALWLSALNRCIDDEGNESETKWIAGATDPRNAVTCIRPSSARELRGRAKRL